MATTIKGDAELRRKLAKLKDLKAVVPALVEGAQHVKGKLATYPPQTEANAPPTPYYIRGRGTQTASGNLGNSEDLGQKWTVKGMKGGLQQVIGNNVSYGPYVQGPGTQAAALKRIGWKDTDEVAKEEEETVLKQIKARVDIILATG